MMVDKQSIAKKFIRIFRLSLRSAHGKKIVDKLLQNGSSREALEEHLWHDWELAGKEPEEAKPEKFIKIKRELGIDDNTLNKDQILFEKEQRKERDC